MNWLMKLFGRDERDRLTERVEAKVGDAQKALSASQQATNAYWEQRRKELSVVDARVAARRRE